MHWTYKDALFIMFFYFSLTFTILCLVFGLNSGHGSFSDSPILNSVVGHILHSSILVPYHGWWVCYNFLCQLSISQIFTRHMLRLSFKFAEILINYTALESYRRISHRTHHQNHGNVENDESWVPVLSLSYYFKYIYIYMLLLNKELMF